MQNQKLFLTEEGKRYAEQVYETHCTVREFLQALGVTPAQAEEDACKMEHTISKETLTKLHQFLEKQKKLSKKFLKKLKRKVGA